MNKLTSILLLVLCLQNVVPTFAATRRYRLSLRDDPATSVVIGWEQNGGSSPAVYYGTTDFGTNWASYPIFQVPSRTVSAHGMDNSFVRLTGLMPDTKYYFVVKDSDGTSNRFWFKTVAMGNNQPLSIISGGDSRASTNSGPRENANKLVAKLRPDFVMFGGDYTWLGLSFEWSSWMDDWQLTTSADGRMYPVIWERGNHELSSGIVYDLFDVPSADEYYNIPVGGTFMNVYTLNTEISVAGNQKTWLETELQNTADNFDWNIAQYHRSIRPHTTTKTNEDGQYNAWAQLFYDYQVRLIIESDAHDIKTTWPIKPSTGPNSDDGYERDSIYGSVYVGEGCWGAPLRTNDNNRSWTRNSDSFNSFKWMKVTRDTIAIRTIGTDNANSVGSVVDNDRFNIPTNANVWSPSNGSVVYIVNNKYLGRPMVAVTYPFHQQYFSSTQNINIIASATDAGGSIQEVKFYINDVYIGNDLVAPYSLNWTMPSDDNYVITAWAIDNDGWHNVSDDVEIHVGDVTIEATILTNNDDAEEHKDDGSVDLTSSDLELGVEEWVWPLSDEDQWVGLRYDDLAIPQGATITNAYIQFTADSDESNAANLSIFVEDVDNSDTFQSTDDELSSRVKISNSISWIVNGWTDGDAGLTEQTPNIMSLIQQIINKPTWQSGNAITIFIDGTGTRSAYSRDTDANKSPKLIVEFSYNSPLTSYSLETPEIQVNIYPNPASKTITVDLGNKNGSLSIYDIEGKFIIKKELMTGQNIFSRFNLHLTKGIYLFEINSGTRKSMNKIVIE